MTDKGEISDGFHTFNELYHHRAVLFAVIVRDHKDKAWKSWRHEDGLPCFGGGWFIVGVDTPEGSYTYHYEAKYWDLFDCAELPVGKHWDGHKPEDVTRGCGQSILSHITIQQICTDAKYDDVCLAYRVAIPRQRFSSKNVFSTM